MMHHFLQPARWLRVFFSPRPVPFRYRGYYYDYRVDRCHKPVEHYRAERR